MSNKPVARMSVQARREQLLNVGSRLFSERPYDQVWIDDVAEQAGVSRGLLYHYFGSKRGFLLALIERETAALLTATTPDDALDPQGQTLAALEAYFAYVQRHPQAYQAIFRGAPSTDAELRALIDANLDRQADRILRRLFAPEPGSFARLAVKAWLGFVVTAALEWIDHPNLDLAEIRDLCASALEDILSRQAEQPKPLSQD